jgi:hypothetical protein
LGDIATTLSALFWLNRICDTVFVIDLVLAFFRQYEDPSSGRIVHQFRPIAARYMRFWFWIDLVSVIPWDAVAFALRTSKELKLLRLVRLLRLLRLVKLMKASVVLEEFESSMAVNYGIMDLCMFLIAIITISHWLGCACAW